MKEFFKRISSDGHLTVCLLESVSMRYAVDEGAKKFTLLGCELFNGS